MNWSSGNFNFHCIPILLFDHVIANWQMCFCFTENALQTAAVIFGWKMKGELTTVLHDFQGASYEALLNWNEGFRTSSLQKLKTEKALTLYLTQGKENH